MQGDIWGFCGWMCRGMEKEMETTILGRAPNFLCAVSSRDFGLDFRILRSGLLWV